MDAQPTHKKINKKAPQAAKLATLYNFQLQKYIFSLTKKTPPI